MAAAKGYRIIVTMPERMSQERVALLRYLGAEIVTTPGTLMRDAVDARRRAGEADPERADAGAVQEPGEPRGAPAHDRRPRSGTTPAARSTSSSPGVGTGGTITGVGEVLKLKKPGVRVVAVEPAKAAVLSGGRAGNHMIQGIGAGFVPDVLNRQVIDEIVAVSEDDAFAAARLLARSEGILVGISSGAALAAAVAVGKRPEAKGKVIVVMLPDGGERYASTPLFAEMLAATSRVPRSGTAG